MNSLMGNTIPSLHSKHFKSNVPILVTTLNVFKIKNLNFRFYMLLFNLRLERTRWIKRVVENMRDNRIHICIFGSRVFRDYLHDFQEYNHILISN